DTLSNDEKEQVALILQSSKALQKAYYFKLKFGYIFHAKSRQEAESLLSRWIAEVQLDGMKEFSSCCQTFTRWSREILNYFDHPYTNGYTEGVNNKIKVLKRNAYGVSNFKRFRNRILYMMKA
ncbi:transposase, partial [Eubacterium barkeri]